MTSIKQQVIAKLSNASNDLLIQLMVKAQEAGHIDLETGKCTADGLLLANEFIKRELDYQAKA